MDDAKLHGLVRASLAAEIELFAGASPHAHCLRWPGVLASVVPATPDRSLFNAVLADSAVTLRESYERLAAEYRKAGVRAFTVWTDPGDDASARWLTQRGHLLDGQPLSMAAPLDALTLPPLGELDVYETRDLALVGRVNDAAYGFPSPAFDAAFVGPLPPAWRAYAARIAGEVACVLTTCDVADADVGISAVATLPAHRGKHLASRLLAHALREAAARGRTVTTLEASRKGATVYSRLGYRTLGAMSMWEHRVSRV